MVTEAIAILSKREDLYSCIIKAELFEKLNVRFPRKCLGELIVDKKNGTWGEAFLKDGKEVKVLRSQDIRHGFIDYAQTELRYVSIDDFAKNKLSKGDILVVKSSGSEDLVGKSQIFNIQNEDVIPSNFLMRIRPNKELVFPDYLDLFLKSPQALQWRVNKQSTTTGLRNLETEGYLSVEVPLPSLEEQKEIVTIFKNLLISVFDVQTTLLDVKRFKKFKLFCDSYKGLGTCFTQQQSYLQLLRQTVLQEAVQGKLTKQDANDEPATELLKRIKAEKQKLVKEGKLKKEKELLPISEDEISFELPKGWVWCRLGEIFNDLKYGTSQKCDYKKAKHAVLRIPNLSNGVIDFQDLKFATLPEAEFKSLKLEFDDMLVIRSNGSENLVGRSAVFKGAELDCAYAGYLMRLRFHKKLLSIDYLHQVLESRFIRNLIQFPLRTTSGVKNINSTEVSNLLIPLPPLAEQQRIVDKVQQLQQQLSALETQVQQSRQYAQQLLQAVLKEAFEINKKEYATNEQLTMAAEE